MSRGGKRAGAGRPKGSTGPNKPLADKKTQRIVVQCTEKQRTQLIKQAEKAGQKLGPYILNAMLNKKILEK